MHINPKRRPRRRGGAAPKNRWLKVSGPCRRAGRHPADRLDGRPDPAAGRACAGRRPAAAGRAFVRRRLAVGPDAGCSAAAGSASAGSGCSSFAPRELMLSPEAPPQESTQGTPESCAATKERIWRIERNLRAETGTNGAEMACISHALVGAIVIDQGRNAGAEPNSFDRREENDVDGDQAYL